MKKYRYSTWLKLLAIVLCISGMLTIAYGLLKASYFEAATQNQDFKESKDCREILQDTYFKLSEIVFVYQNEEYIKSGKTINENYLNNEKNNLINHRQKEISEINNKYNNFIEENNSYGTTQENPNMDYSSASYTPSQNNNQLTDTLAKERDKELQEVMKNYDLKIEAIKSDCINEHLSSYKDKLENLNSILGIYYTVIEAGKVTHSNTDSNSAIDEFYKELPFSTQFTSQENIFDFFKHNFYYNYFYDQGYKFNVDPAFPSNTIIYLGISQDKYNTELANFNENCKEGLLGIKLASIGFLAFIIGLIYLIYSAGRRVDMDGVQLLSIDHVYPDAALAVSIGSIFLLILPLYYIYVDKNYLNNFLLLLLSGLIISVGTLIGISFVTMFTKRLKRHEVIKNTLIFKFFTLVKHEFFEVKHSFFEARPKIASKTKTTYTNLSSVIVRKTKTTYTTLSSVYDHSPLALRLVLIFGAYVALILISIPLICSSAYSRGGTAFILALFGFAIFFGVNITAIYFLLKTFKALKDIRNGAERIRSGELSYNIPEEGIPELKELSQTINKIADGFKGSVSSQVKAERMKAELITNVSHDLKTPLTSIITYVDLLKKEGLQSENADKYLDIIDTKSQRLKALTEDLFDAAKATSGNLKVNNEKLDVVALINQGLGELSDKIQASGLKFRTNLPSEKLFVSADGKLLWRVIENLLSNVFKYALPGSRVYIDAFSTADSVSIIIKNISAYELNVSEDELMERFKRGDASRHSEGSGLGLSIAKSLTELQGGSFNIEIDGDLFKATILLVGCE